MKRPVAYDRGNPLHPSALLNCGVATKVRILCLSFCLLFLCAYPQASFCQAVDQLTSQFTSALKEVNIPPDMVPLVQEKAEKGDAKSQYVLGALYFTGQSVEKSDAKAVLWMTKAANQDFRFSQTQLGLMYLVANDIPENYVRAREWLLKGAAHGESDAWNALGVVYSQGLGVEVNGEQAVGYFREAVDAGFDVAQYNLGYLYYVGKVVPQDYKEAARLFKLAADQDHIKANYSLGVMYRDGQGLPLDPQEAARLFQRLAEKHHFAPAEHNLGAIYYLGKSVPKNLVLAYMWVSLAANAGFEPSKKLLPTLVERMTQEQVAEAKQKAQDWNRAHGS